MLAALLTNLPEAPPESIFSSGPLRGFGTWNRDWARDYGPDVDKAKKAKLDEVQEAIDALSNKTLPEHFEEAQTLIERKPMAYELMKAQDDLVSVMTAYYAFKRWQKKRNKMAAILLLS